ncbi:hypothetical protein [Rhizobium favelukesii]|uniref:Uncharacterized protein n=1 Tax=Rhizobium favelukesii TaxID=348824 RepID=W6RMK6_9HYPH|nr:hypothetical protein [Rhizobium favelukesii]CDM62004.1 hypothetical protein LPU83_pLPU83d_0633 [Rhizobium favelukesii]
MSLLNLLSLDDKDIDTVTTVVRTWARNIVSHSTASADRPPWRRR